MEVTLSAIREFHDALRLVDQAGLPIRLFDSRTRGSEDLERTLSDVESRVVLSRLPAGGDSESMLPIATLRQLEGIGRGYLAALVAWQATHGDPSVLAPFVARASEQSLASWRNLLLFFYPLLWGHSQAVFWYSSAF